MEEDTQQPQKNKLKDFITHSCETRPLNFANDIPKFSLDINTSKYFPSPTPIPLTLITTQFIFAVQQPSIRAHQSHVQPDDSSHCGVVHSDR